MLNACRTRPASLVAVVFGAAADAIMLLLSMLTRARFSRSSE
jgi:hypothetical protein